MQYALLTPRQSTLIGEVNFLSHKSQHPVTTTSYRVNQSTNSVSSYLLEDYRCFMKEMVINNEGLLGKRRNNGERKKKCRCEKLPPTTTANGDRKVAGREEEYI